MRKVALKVVLYGVGVKSEFSKLLREHFHIVRMADAIYGLLKYPALPEFSASKGMDEVNSLKWENAALKLKGIYSEVIKK